MGKHCSVFKGESCVQNRVVYSMMTNLKSLLLMRRRVTITLGRLFFSGMNDGHSCEKRDIAKGGK